MKHLKPEAARFEFATQRPRQDGCGGYVLQMLTGLPYDEIAQRIGWTGESVHRSTWVEMRKVLSELNWQFEGPVPASSWDEVHGLAIVHVKDDHFMFHDHGLFYDPGEPSGPQQDSERVPLSFMMVTPPRLP